MALIFEELQIKNFMSFGNTFETIRLDRDPLTLVLGENLDKGEDSGERNGTGKSSVIQALHFAIFGLSIGNKIKKPNLINKTNEKNLEVILKFRKGQSSYEIRRCRKPEKLEFLVDDLLVNNQGEDEGQGEMKETQEEINRVLGLSADMFNQSILLSTYVEPFLSQGTGKQRELIEELLGVTLLSEKAANLKEMLRETKNQLEREEFKISTILESNSRILKNHEKNIIDLTTRATRWQDQHESEINSTEEAIAALSEININQEIKNHEQLEIWVKEKAEQDAVLAELKSLESVLGRHERTIQQAETRLEELSKDLEKAKNQKCPTCHQDVHDERHSEVMSTIEEKIAFYQAQVSSENSEIDKIQERLQLLNKKDFDAGKKPEVFYDRVQDAYKHKSNLKNFKSSLKKMKEQANPYLEQIESQPDAPIQEINTELRDDLNQLKDHQDFLLKILTSKDSTVRKRIIDQNISYLNSRLGLYLEKLGLPHEVEFHSDLSTEISMLGNDYDFANLSRGERARLSLGLAFAFRDVWESLNQSINLMFIDEVMDNGIDSAGLEAALKTLKTLSRERSKNLFIVSHREELISRCSTVLSIVKEGGFSSAMINSDSVI